MFNSTCFSEKLMQGKLLINNFTEDPDEMEISVNLKHVVLNKFVHIPADSGITLPVRVSSNDFDEKQPLLLS